MTTLTLTHTVIPQVQHDHLHHPPEQAHVRQQADRTPQQQENKHLTQQQLYELRVKLQNQERLQNQASSSIGTQQPFFTPEAMTDEVKAKSKALIEQSVTDLNKIEAA